MKRRILASVYPRRWHSFAPQRLPTLRLHLCTDTGALTRKAARQREPFRSTAVCSEAPQSTKVKASWKSASETPIFREGDPRDAGAKQLRHRWEKAGDDEQGTGVFNGDVGEIIRIFPQQECMVIRFDDRIATYTFDMLNELSWRTPLPYINRRAASLDAVVLALSDGLPRKLLTRTTFSTPRSHARSVCRYRRESGVVRIW